MAGRKKDGISGLRETTGGTKRDDRIALGKFTFEPISIDTENAQTVIYMLRSPENAVVLRAIASLDRYGRKALENSELLSELGILEYILPLLHHEDFLVRRFSQKLTAVLCDVEEFRRKVLEDDTNAATFVQILKEEEDVVMHEFASLTLVKLSSECYVAGRILQIEGCIETIYDRLTSSDPDVQKNCLDIMKNLLNEMDGIQYFLDSSRYDMVPILNLSSSAYPVIQLTALEVIDKFLSWSMENKVLYNFRDAEGIETVIGIVENQEWTDLHLIALDILLKVVDNPEIINHLYQSGCITRLVYLLELCSGERYIEKILGILARLSQVVNGQKALHASNMGQIFAEYLKLDSISIQESACLGIGNMAKYPPAIESIMATNPICCLLDIVTDSSKIWKLREMAAYALNVLSHEDYRSSAELLENLRFERLLPLLQGRSTPMELSLHILQIFMGISLIEKNRLILVNENLIKGIMDLIQEIEDPYPKPPSVQVAAMECLSCLLVEESARSLFQQLYGAWKIIACIKNRYAIIRQWAALMIMQLSQNVDFVKTFIRLGGLLWLINEKVMRYSVPSWESAIQALFKAYLPAKFAFTGRLDLHDLTQEGFYILRHQSKIFFILDDLLEIRASPAYPVYVANFNSDLLCPSVEASKETFASSTTTPSKKPASMKKEEGFQEKDLQKYMKRAGRSTIDDSSWDGSLLTYDSYDHQTAFSIELENFSSCPRDPYLPEYLGRLKTKLVKETEQNRFRDLQWLTMHPKLLRRRAQILARFVADEMSGPHPDIVCKDHFLEMHLNDIRYNLGTNIIPLGHIRVGSYLERALLFKVLADKVGIPCVLERGTYGRAWIEIAIPAINIELPTESKETQTSLPKTPPTSVRSSVTAEDESVWEEEVRRTAKNNCESPCYRNTSKEEKFAFPQIRTAYSNAFPTRLLKPNAVIDLVHQPGRIMPIDSYEADEYKGSYLCMQQRSSCK